MRLIVGYHFVCLRCKDGMGWPGDARNYSLVISGNEDAERSTRFSCGGPANPAPATSARISGRSRMGGDQAW
jgi:hypothetical protein